MINRRTRAALLSLAVALLAALAAAGCSGTLATGTASSPARGEADCARTPGAAGIWRPQLGYCEY